MTRDEAERKLHAKAAELLELARETYGDELPPGQTWRLDDDCMVVLSFQKTLSMMIALAARNAREARDFRALEARMNQSGLRSN